MSLDLPDTFQYEKQGHIAIMTINRPKAMNAFTAEMLAAMDACFEDFQRDGRVAYDPELVSQISDNLKKITQVNVADRERFSSISRFFSVSFF